MVPNFNSDGLLPEGIYDCTLEEFEKRFTNYFDRRKLYEKGIIPLMADLRAIACKSLYLDGSYVTNKIIPNDFDACWDNRGLNLAEVKQKFPFLWNPIFSKKKYGGDVFPAFIKETRSGILFIDFFQTHKMTGLKKGIIKLNL
jgi:hypothetical protein